VAVIPCVVTVTLLSIVSTVPTARQVLSTGHDRDVRASVEIDPGGELRGTGT
jgi:hypothetical protein